MAPERKELFDKGELPLHGDTRLPGLLSCSVSVIFGLGSQWNTSFLHFLLSFDSFGCIAQHAGSLTRDQGSNMCPLQWKCGVLTTGPPGKPLISSFN